ERRRGTLPVQAGGAAKNAARRARTAKARHDIRLRPRPIVSRTLRRRGRMIPLFIMGTGRFHHARRRSKLAVPLFGAVWLIFAGGVGMAAPMAPPAAPVPSTGAPHPSAPVVKVAGMTLEIRSGRIVV